MTDNTSTRTAEGPPDYDPADDLRAAEERRERELKAGLEEVHRMREAIRSIDRPLTPDEWSMLDGVVVTDPDGWRYDSKPWVDPITRTEWERRKSISTVGPRGGM